MQMSEFDREEVLAQRLEEMQRIQDKRNLDQMLKEQSNRGGDPDSVSKAAKRSFFFVFFVAASWFMDGFSFRIGQHTIRGATKEKSRKLDELKAKRKAKGEKKRVRLVLSSLWLSYVSPFRQRRTPRNGTVRRLLWTWRRHPGKRKMVRSQSSRKRRRRSESCSGRLILTMNL
jgi:hypothetical protein